MPLALVHDWLNQLGGAEDVLETLVGMFPDAPIYTSIYWRAKMPATWPHGGTNGIGRSVTIRSQG